MLNKVFTPFPILTTERPTVSLDEVKAMILAQDPKAFDKKTAAKKKTAGKKGAKKK